MSIVIKKLYQWLTVNKIKILLKQKTVYREYAII